MIIVLIIWFIMSLIWLIMYMIDDGATDLVSWLSMILFIFLPPIYVLIRIIIYIINKHLEKKRYKMWKELNNYKQHDGE